MPITLITYKAEEAGRVAVQAGPDINTRLFENARKEKGLEAWLQYSTCLASAMP
jgi:hypothetical protein